MAIYPPIQSMCLDPKLGIFAGKAKPGDKTFDGEVRSVQRTGNIITITFKAAAAGSTSTPNGPKAQQYSEFDVLMLGVGDSAIGEVVTEPEAETWIG